MKNIIRLAISAALSFALVPAPAVVGQQVDGAPRMKEIKGKKLKETVTPQMDKKKHLWGYAGSDGKFIVKPVFAMAFPFEGKLARVSYAINETDTKWGIINEKGLFVVPPMYDEIGPFSSDSLSVVKSGNVYSLLNNRGLRLFSEWYESIEHADFGYIMKYGKLGTADHKGQIMIEPEFDEISMLDAEGGLMHVRKGRKWGILKDGHEVVNLDMDEKAAFMRRGEKGRPDLFYAYKDGKTGVVTSTGKYVVPFIYDSIRLSASGDYYVVRKDGKYGAISLKMDDLVPPILNSSPEITDELFRFYDDGEYYGADKTSCFSLSAWSTRALIIGEIRDRLKGQLPDWAFGHVIEENRNSFQERLSKARTMLARLEDSGYSESSLSAEEGIRVKFPKEWRHKYGLKPVEEAFSGDRNTVSHMAKSGHHYYSHSADIVADSRRPLMKYDVEDNLLWTFYAEKGEAFYDIEETENFLYLCGSTLTGSTPGEERPLLVQLSKDGSLVGRHERQYPSARFSAMLCENGLLYMITDFVNAGQEFGRDFYPHFLLEDMGDYPGVRPVCAWEPWGEDTYIGGCGLVDGEGKWLCAPVLPTGDGCTGYGWSFGSFSGDFLIFSHDGRYGLMDRSGAYLIRPVYDKLAPLANPSYFKAFSGGKAGVVDYRGNVIVPLEYDYVGNMEEDMIIVGRSGKYGCYDSKGIMLFQPEFDMMKEFSDGKSHVQNNGLYGFVDNKGNVLRNSAEEEEEPRSRVVVSLSGKMLVKLVYDSGGTFSCGLAPLSQDGKFGYINMDGNFAVPRIYDNVTEFNVQTSLARVGLGGKWGAIDTRGHEIIPVEFDGLEISSDGYIIAEKGGKYGIYTSGGKEIHPPVCEKIELSHDNRVFSHGVAACSYGSGVRFKIDEHGNRIDSYSSM